MIKSEKLGQTARSVPPEPEVTEAQQTDSQESDLITSGGGEARGGAPAQRESAGSRYSGSNSDVQGYFTDEELDKWLDPRPESIHYYGSASAPPHGQNADADWARLERCEELVIQGKLGTWQYNLLVDRLGFTDYLKLDEQAVAVLRRRSLAKAGVSK